MPSGCGLPPSPAWELRALLQPQRSPPLDSIRHSELLQTWDHTPAFFPVWNTLSLEPHEWFPFLLNYHPTTFSPSSARDTRLGFKTQVWSHREARSRLSKVQIAFQQKFEAGEGNCWRKWLDRFSLEPQALPEANFVLHFGVGSGRRGGFNPPELSFGNLESLGFCVALLSPVP